VYIPRVKSETVFWRTKLVTAYHHRYDYPQTEILNEVPPCSYDWLCFFFLSRLRCLPRQRYPSSSIDLTSFHDSTHGHDFNQGHSRVVMTRKTERRIFIAPSKSGQVCIIELFPSSVVRIEWNRRQSSRSVFVCVSSYPLHNAGHDSRHEESYLVGFFCCCFRVETQIRNAHQRNRTNIPGQQNGKESDFWNEKRRRRRWQQIGCVYTV